jgi:hypothetical protein
MIMEKQNTLCGLGPWRPKFMQRFASRKVSGDWTKATDMDDKRKGTETKTTFDNALPSNFRYNIKSLLLEYDYMT